MEIQELDSAIISYINDNGIKNNFDIILAKIIELNIKGHLSIIYKKDNLDKYNYKIVQNIDYNAHDLNKFEIIVLRFLFQSKMEITKEEFEEKLKNSFQSYNVQYNELERVIKEECINEKLILKDGTYTEKGRNIRNRINEYKKYIENEKFLTGNNTMDKIVQDKNFAISIALHISTIAKDTFIDNELFKSAFSIAKISVIKFIILAIIVFTVIFAFGTIILIIPKELIAWLFIILIIIIAASADIVFLVNKKNKK